MMRRTQPVIFPEVTMPARWDMLLVDARLATLAGASGYGLIEAGAIFPDCGEPL